MNMKKRNRTTTRATVQATAAFLATFLAASAASQVRTEQQEQEGQEEQKAETTSHGATGSVAGGIAVASTFRNGRGFEPYAKPIAGPYANVHVATGVGSFDFFYAGLYGIQDRNLVEHEFFPVYAFSIPLGSGILNTTAGYWMIATGNRSLLEEGNLRLQFENGGEGLFRPTIFGAYDFRDGNGGYLEGGVQPKLSLPAVPLNVDVAVFYNHHYASQQTGWGGVRVEVSSNLPILNDLALALVPRVRCHVALRDDLKSGCAIEAGIEGTINK